MSTTSSSQKLSIIIVGAGTAGLMSALALTRKGHNVTILERSPKLRISGGSYRFDPNAMRLLHNLGLVSELKKISRSSPGVRMRRYSTGEVISVMDTDGGTAYRAHVIERQRMGQIVHDKAVAEGVQVKFGVRVLDVDHSAPSVTLEDGKQLVADLIIGADGANSTVRTKVSTESEKNVKVFNELAYNIYLPRKEFNWGSELNNIFEDDFTNWWIGPGGYVISGAINAELYIMTICLEDKSLPGEGARWHQIEDLGKVRELLGLRLSQWDPRLNTMLQNVERSEFWRVVELPELKSWSSPSGKVLLIGDAAHAIGPHAGAGAAMGVEDALALAEILSVVKHPSDLRDASRLFEDFRKTRVRSVWKLNRAIWKGLTIPDGPVQEERDRYTRQKWESVDWANIKADQFARTREMAFQKWLYQYDAIEEARQFLRNHNKLPAQAKL